MRPLNLEHLRTLVSIADTGSFSAAGRQLHLSAAALGLHVAELERRMGGALVVRHARGAQLSAAGRTLVERSRRILADCADAQMQTQSQLALRSNRLRVATLTCMVLELFPDPLTASIGVGGEPRPAASQLDFVITGASASLQMLQSDAIDLAIVALPQSAALDGLCVLPLCSVPIVACSPMDWNLPESVTREDLVQRPYIGSDATTTLHAMSMRWLDLAAGHAPEITVNFDAAVLRLVAAGMGFALLPSAPKMMQDLQRRVRVSRTVPALAIDFCFVHRRETPQADRISAVMASIAATAARRWPAPVTRAIDTNKQTAPFPVR